MKKAGLLLILITLLFCTGLIGFLIGSYQSGEILISGRVSPAEAEAAATTAVPTASSVANGKVNINSATAEELAALPGIGAVLAQRIIDYRTLHGSFQSVDELSNVSGIGVKKLETIRQYVIVAGN